MAETQPQVEAKQKRHVATGESVPTEVAIFIPRSRFFGPVPRRHLTTSWPAHTQGLKLRRSGDCDYLGSGLIP